MNSLIKNITFILLSGLIWQSFAQDCKGTLIIETDIPDPVIFIDEELLENGKLEIELEPGIYKVIVKEPGQHWDSRSLEKTITLTQCNNKNLSFIFNDEIYLRTDPDDAAVYNTGTFIGYTPLFVSAEYDNLILEKPGYESKIISLKEIYKNNLVSLEYIGKIKQESFFEKNIFKFLVAGIVALGGTTAYYKIKADKKFEEYEFYGDQKLLDETRRYDLISGITFTALQINFAALIYFFLID
jgi:hypothetical protein